MNRESSHKPSSLNRIVSHFDDTLLFHDLSKVINTLLTLDNLHVEILTVI